MKWSQTFRLLILYIIFGVASFIIVSVYAVPHYTGVLLKKEADRLYKTAVSFANNYVSEYYDGSMNYDSLKRQLTSVAAYSESVVWIVDRSGNVILDTSAKNDDARRESAFHPTDFVNRSYLVGDFAGEFSEDMLTVAAQVTVDYHIRGYVLMHEPYRTVIHFSDDFLNVAYLTSILMTALAFLLLLFYWLTTELVAIRIVKAAAAYMEKDFDVTLPKAHDKQYDFIIASLDYMARELATLELDQQKFISNISHDFRSPLTSIRGYIEAIMDGTIPPEMEEKYLHIVMAEVDRLSNMTSGLLELNQYGGHGRMILDREPFDIQESIRQTARSFERRCLEKRIALKLHLSDAKLLVYADQGKIDRVLHNLLDNAIKFSDSNSDIRIETRQQKNKVQISVKDNGIGIPKDQIGKIWDRFYKTDLSRGKDKMGTGIGLSIVKEIMTAHGENITVISTEGVGCEFIFSLPLYEEDE